jgi:hypothetical protein
MEGRRQESIKDSEWHASGSGAQSPASRAEIAPFRDVAWLVFQQNYIADRG